MTYRNRMGDTVHLVPAKSLIPNAKNWREHGEKQRSAMTGVLDELGFCDPLKAYRRADGQLVLVDGHMRAALASKVSPDTEVPVVILDISEADADKVLATMDPLASMASENDKALADLLGSVETQNAALLELISAKFEQSIAGQLQDEIDKDNEKNREERQQLKEDLGYDFVNFSCPISSAQEIVIRRAIRLAKESSDITTTAEALTAMAELWQETHGGTDGVSGEES